MIKIIVKDNLIQIRGHANYATYGEDILCASVSSIVYTTVNGIMNLDKKAISFIDEKEMEIKILQENQVVKILINNMLELLEDLTKQYPRNIKIIKGE